MSDRNVLDIINKARERNARWLNLSKLRLEALPPEIGQLTQLRALWLAGNNLTRLPAEIGNLSKLKRLRLEGNALAELPPEIGLLTELEELQLHKNQLPEMQRGLCLLINLKRLTLAGNLLEELPVEIGQLRALEVLKLGGYWKRVGSGRNWSGGNQIKLLPPEIAQLSNLRYLDVSRNQLTALPPEIARLSNLRCLFVPQNRLTALPLEIAQLNNLRYLDVSYNQLTALPPEIAQLSNLQSLTVSHNQLTALPPKIAQLSNLQSLSVLGNQLTALPPEIAQLSNLQSLDVLGNQLTALPPEIAQLSNLRHLYVEGNRLTTLPPEIARLSDLQYLFIGGNRLTALPPEVARLNNLRVLDASHNQLTALPPEIAQFLIGIFGLGIENNPWRYPPEIIAGGQRSLLGYVRKLVAAKREWVSKLLVVGEGAVGKTCLLRALRGDDYIEGMPTTHGIEINTLILDHPAEPGEKMRLNTWDFGGQQIYHATHQFFLTNRSLYLVVWNARGGPQAGKLDYWLDTIKARTKDSPIFLVATWVDERDADLNLADLKERYPQIKGHFTVSNKNDTGIEQLREAIRQEAARLPLMGELWPEDWANAKKAIAESAKEENHISPNKFSALMRANGVGSAEEESVLSNWLHELGEILYFRDRNDLEDTVILNSQWVTEKISRVLESEEVIQNLGILTRSHMKELWSDVEPTMREHLLRLMQHFDLSYRIEEDKDKSLVVERLPLAPPDYQTVWNALPEQNQILMRFKLGATMPAGVPTWFIARSHRFTTRTHWRHGALFADGPERKHLGLIQAFEHDRYLSLAVRGPAPHNFFALLRDGLEATLKRFEGLEITRKVPCSGHNGGRCVHEFDVRQLEKAYELKVPEIQCAESFLNVPISAMLFGIHADTTNKEIEKILCVTEETLAVAKETLGEVKVTREEIAEYVAYSQREFTKLFNTFQHLDESQCPYIFAMRVGTYDGDLIGLFGPTGSHSILDSLRETVWKRKVELQLYCQQPGCWHPVGYERGKDDPTTGLYQIEIDSDFLRLVAPHLTRFAKLFKLAQPLLGPWVSWAAPEKYAKQFKEDLDRMKKLAEQVAPAVEDSLDAKRAGALVEGRDPREAASAMLRALKRLLEEKDKTGAWGGLTRKLTKEGHYLWLCPFHTEEYCD